MACVHLHTYTYLAFFGGGLWLLTCSLRCPQTCDVASPSLSAGITSVSLMLGFFLLFFLNLIQLNTYVSPECPQIFLVHPEVIVAY